MLYSNNDGLFLASSSNKNNLLQVHIGTSSHLPFKGLWICSRFFLVYVHLALPWLTWKITIMVQQRVQRWTWPAYLRKMLRCWAYTWHCLSIHHLLQEMVTTTGCGPSPPDQVVVKWQQHQLPSSTLKAVLCPHSLFGWLCQVPEYTNRLHYLFPRPGVSRLCSRSALIQCSWATWNWTVAIRAARSLTGGLSRLVRELPSSSGLCPWSLPELHLHTLVVTTLTHWLDFLAWSETCLMATDHWALCCPWLLPLNLLWSSCSTTVGLHPLLMRTMPCLSCCPPQLPACLLS